MKKLLLFLLVSFYCYGSQVDQLLNLLQEIQQSSLPQDPANLFNPQTGLSGVSLYSASDLLETVSKGDSVAHEGFVGGFAPQESFDEMVAAGRIRNIPVLRQVKATCGVHGVKNALLGLDYFGDHQAVVYGNMMSQSYYQSHFPQDCRRLNLREDGVQELLARVGGARGVQNVYVMQNVERFVNVFEFSPQGGVLTEEAANMAYRLSEPNYVVSFVLSNVPATDNRHAVAHWFAFIVRKQGGRVRDIIYMDSANPRNKDGSPWLDAFRARCLFNMCVKNRLQIMQETEQYNNEIIRYKFVEKIQRYKDTGGITDVNLNSLAETTFHAFERWRVVHDRVISEQYRLESVQRREVINLLGVPFSTEKTAPLTPGQIELIKQKVYLLEINLQSWMQQIDAWIGDDAVDAQRARELAQYVSQEVFDVVFDEDSVQLLLSSDQIDFLNGEIRYRGMLLPESYNAFSAELTRIKQL